MEIFRQAGGVCFGIMNLFPTLPRESPFAWREKMERDDGHAQ